MWVPQCARDEQKEKLQADWKEQLELLLSEDYLRYGWIGITRDFVYNWYRVMGISEAQLTKDQDLLRLMWYMEMSCTHPSLSDLVSSGIKIHFLGWGDRIDLMQYLPLVESCDTASLFWQAMYDNPIVGGRFENQLRRPKDYFNIQVSEYTLDLVKSNCWQANHYAQKAIDRKNTMTGKRL
jgi:hypothetical protein